MPNCCICLTTDDTYLFPTLIAAIQARANASPNVADVAIYYSGGASKVVADFARVSEAENIQFASIDPDVIERSHTAYARFFLDQLVPTRYSQFLYLDSDIQIAGSLNALITAHVPPGRFLAAADPLAFYFDQTNHPPKWMAEYFERCSLRAQNYFNSGVLRINRSGWAELGRKAYKFCKTLSPSGREKFWDQDGLNAVGTAARLPMSLKWNFPIFMRNCRVEDQVKPAVYHFMAKPKPWNGSFAPWHREGTIPYLEVLRKYPHLTRYNPAFGPKLTLKYSLQQRVKQCHETLTWGLTAKRNRILEYEAALAAGA